MNAASETPSSRMNSAYVIGGIIFILAVLMTIKFFPGLENEPAYAGISYQTIYPDAFQNDPYRSPDLAASSKIIQHSLIYAFTKLVGPIWLDDRFLAVIYVALVIIGLVGIDRTAQLLGATGLYERLVILLVFAKDHAVLDHKVLLAHHQDFNHNTFAIPIIVWLFYLALARKGLPVVLGLSLLLLTVSIRNAPIPILMAVAVVFVTGKRWERICIAVLSAAGVAAAYWVLFHAFSISDAGRLELWDILRDAAGGDVNPWHDALHNPTQFIHQNTIWFAVIAAAFIAARSGSPAFTGARTIMIMVVLTWLIGGLYISFAPDFLKQPLLQGIAPTRALAWPQNIAYVVLFAVGLRYLRSDAGGIQRLLAAAGLFALFVSGPGNHLLWTGLTLGALMAAIATNLGERVGMPNERTFREFTTRRIGKNSARIAAHTLAAVLVVAYGAAAVGKAQAWKTAFNTGVFGDSAPATWIGVAEYLRDNTPKDAVVLPIAYKFHTNYPPPPLRESTTLTVTRSLGTRSGRAMPVPEDFPGNFRDPGAWRESDRQKAVIRKITQALGDGALCKASQTIATLNPKPDYVVLPENVLKNADVAVGPYRLRHRLEGYAILQYDAARATECPSS